MVNADSKIAGLLREKRSGNVFYMDKCQSFDKPGTSSIKNDDSFCFFARLILLLHIANCGNINLK